MIEVAVYYSGLSLNNLSSWLIILLAHIVSIVSFTTPLLILFIFKPSLNASFIVWQGQDIKVGSQIRAAASGIASIIQTGLGSKIFNCYDRLNLTTSGHPQLAKLKFTCS